MTLLRRIEIVIGAADGNTVPDIVDPSLARRRVRSQLMWCHWTKSGRNRRERCPPVFQDWAAAGLRQRSDISLPVPLWQEASKKPTEGEMLTGKPEIIERFGRRQRPISV